MKKILITGATSMIGVALINECIKNKTKVLAVVRPGSTHLERIPESDLITKVACNLNEIMTIKHYIKDTYDVFYHFGWEGTAKGEREDACFQNKNIYYTLESVRLAKDLGCKTFIGAGSQAEYGRVSNIISPTTPVNPDIAYGVAKYAAGKLSKILSKELGIKHIWTRIFSVYGAYDNDRTLIMYCIDKMLKGEKPLLTKCEQVWDYLHCQDAARAFYLIGEKGLDEAIYCIGNGTAKPLHEYVLAMKNAIDEKLLLGIGELEYTPNQVMHLCADITSLTEDTGFVPEISFEQGIMETIRWYKENRLKSI